jgi:hypothetical protein
MDAPQRARSPHSGNGLEQSPGTFLSASNAVFLCFKSDESTQGTDVVSLLFFFFFFFLLTFLFFFFFFLCSAPLGVYFL